MPYKFQLHGTTVSCDEADLPALAQNWANALTEAVKERQNREPLERIAGALEAIDRKLGAAFDFRSEPLRVSVRGSVGTYEAEGL